MVRSFCCVQCLLGMDLDVFHVSATAGTSDLWMGQSLPKEGAAGGGRRAGPGTSGLGKPPCSSVIIELGLTWTFSLNICKKL